MTQTAAYELESLKREMQLARHHRAAQLAELRKMARSQDESDQAAAAYQLEKLQSAPFNLTPPNPERRASLRPHLKKALDFVQYMENQPANWEQQTTLAGARASARQWQALTDAARY